MKRKIFTFFSVQKKKIITYYRLFLVLFSYKKIVPTNRKPKIIVSLTSIPSRIHLTHLVIESILRQTVLPDKIVLWLSKSIKKKISS